MLSTTRQQDWLDPLHCFLDQLDSKYHLKRVLQHTANFFCCCCFETKGKLINSSPSQKFYIVFQGRSTLKILSITEEQYTVCGAISKLNGSRFLPNTLLYSTLLYKPSAIKFTHSKTTELYKPANKALFNMLVAMCYYLLYQL